MRFCMVCTFYPPYHFGGDAMYVHRLANGLARRGHHIDVIHDLDAYFLARKTEPPIAFDEHPNVRIIRLKSRFGPLSPLLTQQTARPLLKPAVRERLESGDYDVIHFHNPSLIGSAAFRYGRAVKLYTMHEHWLICPMHVLWKFDREPCDAPECLMCCIRGRRPPQLWRYTGRLDDDLSHIDRFLSPSRFTRARHLDAGLDLPITVLPYFVPTPPAPDPAPSRTRPYFLFVGRLVKLKGVDTLIRAFATYRDADLVVVGEGEESDALRAAAHELPHVHFTGACSQQQLGALYRDAVALVMPSIGYEVFGIVLIEAFTHRTPVIVRNRGGMREAVEDSHGGFVYDSDAELIAHMTRLQQSSDLRRECGENGHAAYLRLWSEGPHIDRYLQIVEDERDRRGSSRGAIAAAHA
jgi:glycosyltransferase involved in cell wall biosynthesis